MKIQGDGRHVGTSRRQRVAADKETKRGKGYHSSDSDDATDSEDQEDAGVVSGGLDTDVLSGSTCLRHLLPCFCLYSNLHLQCTVDYQPNTLLVFLSSLFNSYSR